MRVKEFTAFIKEREKVRLAKEAGKLRPWTKDPILHKYRFCSVRREDDRVTRYIAEQWRTPMADEPDLWFAMVVCRLLNLPDSLFEVQDHVLPWKPEKFRKVLHKRRDAGLKNFNPAYIVSTNGKAMDKVDYLVLHVLGPLWAARKAIRPTGPISLADLHKRLIEYDGLGSFMAAQVIADLKYEPPFYDTTLDIPTTFAEDWYTFAASGPGSRRGLNRVYGWDPDQSWKEGVWRRHLADLQRALPPKLPASIGAKLHAQDIQNCLCEFDKYERARLGEGTPKQLYQPQGSK